MGFWKDVALEMSKGKPEKQAIKDTINYYKQYKPSYFNKNGKEKANEVNHIL